MPPLALTSLLQTALPRLSADGRAVISALGCFNGDPSSPADLAVMVGMHSRYQLARVLRRDGLPPLEELAGWARLLYWMAEAQRNGTSLRRLARGANLDVTTAYRLVRRLTGLRWSQLQRLGLPLVLKRFRSRCRANGACLTLRPLTSPRRLAVRLTTKPAVVTAVARARAIAAPPGASRPRWIGPPTRACHPGAVLRDRILIDGKPFDVAVCGDSVACVTRPWAAAVEQVALGPLRAIGSIMTGGAHTRVVFSQNGSTAYVTSQFGEHVGVLDLERGRQIAAIGVPGHPMAAVLALDGRTLFVTTNLDRLCAVALGAGRVVASVSVPQVCTEIALDPSGHRLYVPTWRAGDILEVDARTLRPLRTFHVGGKVQGLVVSASAFTLFAANEDGWLDHIHLCTGRHLARVHFGSAAFGLALSADETVLYVGLLYAGDVIVLDRCTLRVVARLHPGGKPRRIAFDATGRAALVANEAGWVDLVR